MTVKADDGAQLWAERSGEGDPVMLCHGGPGLWDTFEDLAPLLVERGAAVLRWDQRGCGRSERRGPYSVARSVADIDAVRRHFGLEAVTLLGHSWGARLALHYALAHPEHVTRLVYVSGTGIGPDSGWHPEFVGRLRAGIGERLARWEELASRERRTEAEEREMCVLQWSADFAGPDRGRALRLAERMATPWYGVNFACNAEINAETRTMSEHQLHAACGGLRMPVVIVDGAEDIRPRDAVDSLEQALPNVSRVTLAGAGHMPWVERPAEFAAAVAPR
ncbi:alpha/beta hydrolase [Streptomyces agglomeratus]|uniref:Alpha/beta hydrolase n=1 Tax=Streptomyces agglomeratus TaxID=285458 RepID=A0A1E5P475_9ACTN|nr:alpha/beta hydrolase [Streptomyces agglomeratus]OEJ24343.1 alpha/beta hydrolase [Streptomyces agglomeratus]OEJ41706.1 alpha/beta hydrolase [Streptomyces agglomeratus]OEJ43916.1 alpha/beta hydrolase [Streptomyces agglomeratus]OEJ54200.1 alpha/beta hydrolase [Streptomyces agglomeratus]OEJ61570.1 alpha/beta hydrolase [Streptomyces agglomeratus]